MKKITLTLIFLIIILNAKIENIDSDAHNVFLQTLNSVKIEYGKTKELPKYVSEKEVITLIKNESNFDPNCVSSKKAKGLMQIMPVLQAYYNCNNDDIFDVDKNIEIGINHLEYLAGEYKDKKEILQRYYWGNKKQLNDNYYYAIIREAKKIK